MFPNNKVRAQNQKVYDKDPGPGNLGPGNLNAPFKPHRPAGVGITPGDSVKAWYKKTQPDGPGEGSSRTGGSNSYNASNQASGSNHRPGRPYGASDMQFPNLAPHSGYEESSQSAWSDQQHTKQGFSKEFVDEKERARLEARKAGLSEKAEKIKKQQQKSAKEKEEKLALGAIHSSAWYLSTASKSSLSKGMKPKTPFAKAIDLGEFGKISKKPDPDGVVTKKGKPREARAKEHHRKASRDFDDSPEVRKKRSKSTASTAENAVVLSDDSSEGEAVLSLEDRMKKAKIRKKERRRLRKEAADKGEAAPKFSTDSELEDEGDDDFDIDSASDHDSDFSLDAVNDTLAPPHAIEDVSWDHEDDIPEHLLIDGDVDPDTLCPFCSAPMPDQPSERLLLLRDYLLSRDNIEPNPSSRNPKGQRLPVIETASFCRRHEEERVTIPEGLAKGWPTSINWDGLEKRIRRDVALHLLDIINGGTDSQFHDDAKEEWKRNGRKMNNVLSEWSSFDVEQPGYYGPRGFEVFTAVLRKIFVEEMDCLTPFRIEPLDAAVYIRRVLIPETAVHLIQSDLKVDRKEAIEIRRESSAFGKALHGSSKEEEDFARAEEDREAREAQREEEAKKQKTKDREATKLVEIKRKAEANLAKVRLEQSSGRATSNLRVPKKRQAQLNEAESSRPKAKKTAMAGGWKASIREDDSSSSSTHFSSDEDEDEDDGIIVAKAKSSSTSNGKGKAKEVRKSKEQVEREKHDEKRRKMKQLSLTVKVKVDLSSSDSDDSSD